MEMIMLWFLLALASFSDFAVAGSGSGACSSWERGEDESLYVLYLAAGEDVASAQTAVRLAADHVNNNSSSCYLNGLRLDIITELTMCDRKAVLDIFHMNLFNSTPRVAVLGTGCSLASEAIAEVSQYYNLPLISYASSSISLDQRERFPYFFRTVPSDSYIAEGMVEVIKFFKWSRVMVITEHGSATFRQLSKDLTTRLEENFTVTVENIFLPNNLSRMTAEWLFPPDIRIVILNTNPNVARYIICQAFHNLKWREYKYVWLTQGWYEDLWWNVTSSPLDINCTGEDLRWFLHQQRVLGVNHYPRTPNKTTPTISGISTEDFEHQYETLAKQERIRTNRISYFAYDAVWALVKALDGLGMDVQHYIPLNLSSTNRQIGESVRERLDRVSFLGVTGYVRFEDGSRIIDRIEVLQYNGSGSNTPQLVAVIHTTKNTSRLRFNLLESIKSIWPGGVPSDGSPYIRKRYPFLWLVITSNIFAAINIILAVFCLIFNFIFRKRKLIKLSSPNLNYVIGVGAIIFCVAVFFFAYPPLPDSVLNSYCGIRAWFASIGYSLCFGTINTKMWRVYYIFRNPKPTAKKKPPKDSYLFLFVMVFVLVDLIILSISTGLDNVRLEAELFDDREHPSKPDNNGITVHSKVILCESRWKNVWLGILFGYKIIMQAIGVFLAFKIRKVKIKVLNDSKEVVATLYLSSIILAAVMIITLAFGSYLNVYTAGYAYGIPLSTIVVLSVVFISKMVRLYKDPMGSNLFTHVTRDINTAASAIATMDDHHVIKLQRRIDHLENQLSTFEKNEVQMNASSDFLSPPSTNGKHVQIVINSTVDN